MEWVRCMKIFEGHAVADPVAKFQQLMTHEFYGQLKITPGGFSYTGPSFHLGSLPFFSSIDCLKISNVSASLETFHRSISPSKFERMNMLPIFRTFDTSQLLMSPSKPDLANNRLISITLDTSIKLRSQSGPCLLMVLLMSCLRCSRCFATTVAELPMESSCDDYSGYCDRYLSFSMSSCESIIRLSSGMTDSTEFPFFNDSPTASNASSRVVL